MKKKVFAKQKNAEAIEMTVSVGSVCYKENAVIIHSGETLSFTLTPDADECILELEELHRRTQGVFAYSVEVNSKMVYFRSYEPCADAPNGCFILLPDEALNAKADIVVRVEYGEIALKSARLHSKRLLDTAEEKMLAGFFTPPYKPSQREITVGAVKKLSEVFERKTHMRTMAAFEIPYMNRTDREITEQFEYWLSVAEETRTPLFVNLNSWWGGTPGGPDGKGGYFGDIEYQQVCFDPVTNQYNLSVPNMWSNTPWLTMNHPVLNEARKKRLAAVVQLIQRLLALHSLEEPLVDVRIFLDNEPAYWASFAYGGDPDSGGDFSPFVRRAALLDGVELPMCTPLQDEHRKWLLDNMNRYIDSLAAVCSEQQKHEPITVKNGKQINSNNTASKVYTHVFPFACYPYMDMQYPQWETHVTPHARLGIESSTPEDTRILDYAVRMGSFGNINSERACMHDYEVFIQDYIYGADACMIFNYRDGDAETVADLDDRLKGMTVRERDFPIPMQTFDVFKSGLEFPSVIKTENMAVCGYRNRRVWRPETVGTGRVLIKAGKALDYGACLTVELWAFSHAKTGSIALSVGSTPDAKRRSVYVPEHGNEGSPIYVDIPLDDFSADDTVWLLLEIRADTFEEDWCKLNYIWKMRLMRRHTLCSGHINGFCFTAESLRRLNRMVSARADMQKSTASVASDTYLIEGFATLGETGIRCITKTPVFVKLTVNEKNVELYAKAPSGTCFTLVNTKASSIGVNRWRLETDESDAVLTIKAEPLPERVVGRYGGCACGRLKIFDHNADMRGWQPCEEINFSKNTIFRLKIADAPFEEVDISQIPSGSDVVAICSEKEVVSADFKINIISGVVSEYSPACIYPEHKNTTVTVETKDGIRTFTIGRDCRLSYEGAPHQSISGCVNADPKFKVGQRITVQYSESGFDAVLPRAIEIN